VFVMQCGFHAYMESWGLAVENPYYSISDANGGVKIDRIPPRPYRVTVWHPFIGEAIKYDVTGEAPAQTRRDVKIDAPIGRLYANQMVENPYVRYTVTEDIQRQIVPTLEKQTY